MKAVYNYPEMFLHKVGDLYWATGHPPKKTLPEENWQTLAAEAHRRVAPNQLSENIPKLRLHSEFGNIDYVRTGIQGAPIVVLVPGFPDCWYTFHKIMPILARKFDVISYSPPGHGYSTYTPRFDFKMDTYCLVLRMIMKRLNLQQVHLIGHSVGGEQSIRTILQTKGQDLIKSLTLINAWGPSVFPRKTAWDFSEDVTTWPIVGKELVRIFGGKLGGMKEMFKKVFYRPHDHPHLDELEQQISKPFLTGTTFNLFINKDSAEAIAQMQKEQKRINESVRDYFLQTRRQYGYLPKIPVLVIGTKHDRIFPYPYARGLFRSIQQHNPKTFFRKIKASGHMPAIETPNRLAYKIQAFLDKTEQFETTIA